MKWLLAVPADMDMSVLVEKVSKAGGTVDDAKPLPQGSAEKIVRADGPRDMEARLVSMGVSVKASPNSDFEIFH